MTTEDELAQANEFQSTPPRGGATDVRLADTSNTYISIHAPARGGDLLHFDALLANVAFQSTPPRGGATMCTTS